MAKQAFLDTLQRVRETVSADDNQELAMIAPKGFMAIDQFGRTYHLGVTRHPRKELMKQTGASNARKMYIDKKDGSSPQVGYVCGKLWCTLYEVTPWEHYD